MEKADVGKVVEPNHRRTAEKLVGRKLGLFTIQTVEEKHE